jgi:ResB-like family
MASGGTEQVASAVRGSPPSDAGEESSPEKTAPTDSPAARSWKSDYARALRWCGASVLVGWATQHLLDAAGVDPSWFPQLLLAVGAGLVVFALVAVRKYKRSLGATLVSNPLIVSVLSMITLATVVGTLIPQRINPAGFDKLYGSSSGFMRALYLDDLFHSLWLAGLVALMATALVAIAIKRWPWTFPKWGYVAAHLGPVIILFGSVFGQIDGVKGRVDLEVGKAATEMVTQDWRTGELDRIPLPFAVRLDDFHIESHEPVYRVFVFKHTGSTDDNASFEPVLSVSPDKKGQRVTVDDRFSLRVDSFVAEAGGGAERHVLVLGGTQVPIEPGKSYDVAGKHISVGKYFPHFTYDIATKQAGNVSDRPVNPAVQVEVRKGGADGEVEYDGWLFANMPGFSMAGHQDGTRDVQVPVYRHEGGGKATGPTLKLSVLQGDKQIDSRELLTVNGRHTLAFADGKYVAVFRNRDTEAKNYYSKLSILKGGAAVESREIFVNDPFNYAGYAFYQANFNPENLRYSGIDVVRDPGLWFVYGGLVLMLLGVLHIFYLRTLGRRSKESAA